MRRAYCSYLLLLAAAAIFPVAAQSTRNAYPCGKVDSWSVGYNFGRKIKASADSNDQVEVSQPILENVIHQLQIKVGTDFINNLHFSHVQGVDFNKTSELKLKDLKRIDAYEFTFEVRVGENGGFIDMRSQSELIRMASF